MAVEKDADKSESGPGEGEEPTVDLGEEEEAAVEEEGGAEAAAEIESEPPAVQASAESGSYIRVAAVSGAVLLFALAFFVAGFFVGGQMDGDEEGATDTPASASDDASDDPAWGPDDASVVIEEFADFQCPYCGQFALETLPSLREAYGDKVKFIYRDFPLSSIHEDAQKAAEAGQCAQEQGLFWEYHNILFQNTDALSEDDLRGYAETVGADVDEFNECLDSDRNTWEVLLDTRDGSEAGVSGTPAFVINGLLLGGVRPFEQFQAIIESALASGGS